MKFTKKHISLLFLFTVFCILTALTNTPLCTHAQTYYVDVTSYGAYGTDKEDDTEAIQAALDTADNISNTVILIPTGTYYISNTLYIQSNTTLKLADDAVIKRTKSAYSKNMLRNTDASHVSTGYPKYSLSQNIHLTGGTWDGGEISKAKSGSNLIYIGHANNISIKNTNIKNCYGAHAIEFAGVKKGIIQNCNITGFRYEKSGFTSEAIQLDVCYKNKQDGQWAPGFMADKTPCTNIIIEKNTITDYPRGVGVHHTLSGHQCSNITIRNNTFKRSSASKNGKSVTGVYLLGVKNVAIANNSFNHYGNGALIYNSSNIHVTKNRFRYNNNTSLYLGNAARKFTFVKNNKKEDDKDQKETTESTKEPEYEILFSCPGIQSGKVTTLGHTYKYSVSNGKSSIKLKQKPVNGQKFSFYGNDNNGNKFYQTRYYK